MEDQFIVENSQTKVEEQQAPLSSFDPHLAIIILHCALCGIIIIAVLIIKFFFSNYFTEIKNWYNNDVNAETKIEDVVADIGVGGPMEEINLPLSEGLVNPIKGEITSPFGYRLDPFTGKPSNHSGLDIGASKGENIVAAASGVVEKTVKGHKEYGNYIIINHGGSFSTLYAHCDSIVAKPGDRVSAGEHIAECGSTGRSTGNHLHFEIRINEKRIDPEPFLNYRN